MKCPRHYRVPLEKTALRGIEVEQCPQCTGFWVEADELKRVLGSMDPTATGSLATPACADDEAPMRCPRCGAVAVLVPTPQVQINVCSACQGVWLDANELEKLKALDHAGELDPLWSRL